MQEVFSHSSRRLGWAAALCLIAPAGGAPEQGYILRGQVAYVMDGDSLILRSGSVHRRIRLLGIDAPERAHGTQRPGQPYAEAARRQLVRLVAGKTLAAQCRRLDHYGRDLCVLVLPDGRQVNRQQVISGHAWALRTGDGLDDRRMARLQRSARQMRRGLWAEVGAIAPWKWRHDCWKARHCE
ncbi:thermonuclease family protein [Bordetella avium]|uniref:Nuclease n=1 Tax=Bordetella avium (strain 197N) TaxID=360910 RepID=Q2KX60_BORA1|nr:thermonuclease family protein [Bordetella avium]WQE34480.1 thermonuclease family protein [Bordetella avium]CAJ50153.1 nuclease [Bordetella avium 197N]SUV68090.1 nuclease [Bordetella avium]